VIDTLRTHVKGVLTRNPDWGPSLVGFQVECAWMVGAWDDVRNLVECTNDQTGPVVMARLLLAMRTGEAAGITEASRIARSVLGSPITASAGGVKAYRRSYDAVLNLHLVHELEVIHRTVSHSTNTQVVLRRDLLRDLSQTLTSRLETTLPTFRAREPILSMRRTAFSLPSVTNFSFCPSHFLISTNVVDPPRAKPSTGR
jgi:serine/threonine-protein kinase ATR